MTPDRKPPGHEESFFRIAKTASALCLGAMAAFLYSLKSVNPELRFEFSPGSIVAAILAGALSWSFWNSVASLRNNDRAAARRFAVISAVLALGTLGAFGYSLRGVSAERTSDVVQGVLLAFFFLGVLGVMFWRVVRFFEKE